MSDQIFNKNELIALLGFPLDEGNKAPPDSIDGHYLFKHELRQPNAPPPPPAVDKLRWMIWDCFGVGDSMNSLQARTLSVLSAAADEDQRDDVNLAIEEVRRLHDQLFCYAITTEVGLNGRDSWLWTLRCARHRSLKGPRF